MAEAPAGYKTRLEPQDEFPHDPGEAKNYNESMYFNVFDPKAKTGGWFRIGNRPNEGYAEMTVCVYLPDGRVAFTFGRPNISNNDEMNAGGLKIEIVEPFKRIRLTYAGKLLVLARPFEMADPKAAFRENPRVEAEIALDFTGISPMWGGETVREDGTPLEIDPEKSFARAHYEQHVAASGTIRIGEESHRIDGFGLRDKSWGPRHWQAINWYRWCPMNFGRDFAMMLSIVADDQGNKRQGGMVLKDGVYDVITECSIESDWDANGYQTALRSRVKTESGASYEVEGRVISLIPLRNRRTTAEGEELVTRITEGFTEYRCDGKVGYGLSEYLDQIKDGRPTGTDYQPPG